MLFCRLAGCNKWNGHEAGRALGTAGCAAICDTDFVGGRRMSDEEIVYELARLDVGMIRRVVISGGEPTMQDLRQLVITLKKWGWEVHLETNGSNELGPGLVALIDHITCSPKQNFEQTKLERCDDLKILWPPIAPDITPAHFASFKHTTLWLQPVMPPRTAENDLAYNKNLAATIDECIKIDARLSLQTHKSIGVP